MAAGRFAEAAAVYAQLVKAVPNNPGLLLNHGMALHLAGDDQAALAPLQAAIRLDAKIAPAHLFLGAAYLRLNQPAKALPPLRQFLALDPEHIEARQMIADAALLSGRNAEAIEHLAKLSRLQPDRPGVWYQLGRAYEGAAAEAFDRMAKLFPESASWFALLADSRSKTSQTRAAFYFYRKALSVNPRMRGLHASIAGIYRRNGHEDWARQEEAAELKLGKPDCTVSPLECDFAAGRFESILGATRAAKTEAQFLWRIRAADQLARRSFVRLAALPASPESFRFQAETARDQNRHADAAAAWREALRLQPGNPDFQAELISSLILARKYEEAQDLVGPLLKQYPGAPDLNYLQGDLLLNQQLADRAVPHLEQAVKADPANLPAHASLARALIATGRPADALPHAKAALELDTDGSLHFQLARAYQASGQAEAAKAALAQYQQIKARSNAQDRVLEEEVQITPPAK